jgi:hypothetical protein
MNKEMKLFLLIMLMIIFISVVFIFIYVQEIRVHQLEKKSCPKAIEKPTSGMVYNDVWRFI